MRYKEFLKESPGEIASLIKRDCAGYLAGIFHPTQTIAWRGMQNKYESDVFGKHKARLADRTPGSTSKELHDRINAFFVKNFGYPFRNGVFVTGDMEQADSYAEPYAIFPIVGSGAIKMLWHPQIDDLYAWLVPDGKWDALPTEEAMNKIESVNDGFRTNGIEAAIKSGNEIMLYVEEYYYVHPDTVKRLIL